MLSPQAVTQTDALLDVAGLKTYFFLRGGILKAVDGVSFQLKAHETLAIVGGSVKLDGLDLLTLGEPAMRRVRGKDISMIFQEPMTSLNPVMTVGNQIAETLLLHEDISRSEAMRRAGDILRLVRIPEVEQRLKEYP